MSTPLLFGLVLLVLLAAPLTAAPGTPAAPGDGGAVLENECLRVVVSPVGARIVSLVDKVRGGEQVKMLDHVGGLAEVRFNGVINLNDLNDAYDLKLDLDAAAGPTVTATFRAPADEDTPTAATVVKRFTLLKDSGRIRCEVTLTNDGATDLAVMPWVRHLLLRGLQEQPEEAHMSPYGVFQSGKPVPGRPDLSPRADHHHFPAANWSTRVTMPPSAQTNTLGSILHPGELLKVFNWHRGKENFCTQEFIAAPLFMTPGQTQTLAYDLILTAPVQNIVYASPTLVIGATPHPTGIAADSQQVELDFAATSGITSLQVKAELVKVDAPDKVLQTADFALNDLGPAAVRRQAVTVTLTPDTNYQLRLTFARDGKPWWPGGDVGDRRPVVIPLVVGKPITKQVVFQSQGEARDHLLKVKPRNLTAPQLAQHDALGVFALNPGVRVFPEDRLTSASGADAVLRACRGEYESIQLILAPTKSAPAEIGVAGGDLVGPDGSRVVCQSVNRVLEVKTTIPSRYNASYPVGTYREGLLPAKSLVLKDQVNVPLVVTYRVPEDAAPGRYRGSVRLDVAGSTVDVPVEMEVWNITLPRTNPWMDTPSSLKGIDTGGVVVKGPDGQPLNRQQLLQATVDKHLEYRLTPCDAGFTSSLLALKFDQFEPVMQSYVDRGATKIFLGNVTKLLPAYAEQIPKVEAYLKEKGWNHHFYVRPGFDEASPDLLPQIRERCEAWKALSSIPIMETYYHDEPAPLYDLLDIYCRGVSDAPWVRERMAKGNRFWKVNAFPQHVEVERWTIRPKYLNFWDYHFTGTYIWTIKQWAGVAKWYEDFWCDGGVGNLSATLIWPHETGLLSSLGLEALRDAIEDNTMFWMLREKLAEMQNRTDLTPAQRDAVASARKLCEGEKVSARINSVTDLLALRRQAGEALSALNGPAAR